MLSLKVRENCFNVDFMIEWELVWHITMLIVYNNNSNIDMCVTVCTLCIVKMPSWTPALWSQTYPCVKLEKPFSEAR